MSFPLLSKLPVYLNPQSLGKYRYFMLNYDELWRNRAFLIAERLI